MTALKKVANNTISAIKKNEIAFRLLTDKPVFWRKVQITAGIIGTIGLMVTTLPIGLPAAVVAWGAYFVAAGGAVAGVAQLALKPEDQDKFKADKQKD